jgi:DNA repair protein SbcC/Rad50
MRILSIQLRNYRVYRELDLELPGGVVGVYGANGSGKSTLLESIMWVLFGKARTQKQQLPSSGSQGECSVTLVFEHEGHHYSVKRSISGTAFNVKARVTLGEQVAADGPTDVDRYMQSVLGMDAAAFRASVFAEQKQLAAFSDQAPDKRRQMVLQLLGITPVERARDKARSVAKELQTQLDRATPLLATVSEAEAKLVGIEAEVAASRDIDATANVALERAILTARTARAAVESLHDSKAEDALIREKGNAIRRRKEDLTGQLTTIGEDRAAVEAEKPALSALESLLVDVEHLQAQLGHHKTIINARKRLGLLPKQRNAVAISTDEIEAARHQRDALSLEVASLTGELRGASDRLVAATAVESETAGLDGADGCPLCGQSLGASVEQMRLHRRGDVATAAAAVEVLRDRLNAAKPATAKAVARVTELEAGAADAAQIAAERAIQMALRDAQLQVIADAVSALGETEPTVEDTAVLEEAVSAARATATRLASIKARLERLPKLIADEARVTDQLETLARERETLLTQLKALNFDGAKFAELITIADTTEKSVEVARANTSATGKAVATQQALAKAAREALDQVQAQHAQLGEQRQRAAVLLRTASLLHEFRQYIVGLVGPQLQIQASSLFNQLTGNEYDGLEVDPESYELRVIDHGTAHPMARYSGSEVDLANLALRVAISEQVRFQAGGQIGLLVLDEALASLDADRKDRTLGSLAQLGGRFQQILVVTHSPEVKEQLPNAIEVLRTHGRQSTARVIDAMS